jgi:hypothetical protein
MPTYTMTKQARIMFMEWAHSQPKETQNELARLVQATLEYKDISHRDAYHIIRLVSDPITAPDFIATIN